MNLRQYIRFLLGMTVGMRRNMAGIVAAGVARICVMLLFILACKRLVDIATGAAVGSFPWAAGVMIACVAAQILLAAVVSRLTAGTVVRCGNRLRGRIFAVGLARPYGAEFHSAGVVERMKKDTDTVSDLVASALPASVVTVFQLAAAFALLASLDWRLALIMVAIMPAAMAAGRGLLRRMRTLTSRIRILDTHIQAHTQEHLRHRLVDAAFQAESRVTGRLGSLQLRLYRLVMRRNRCSIISHALVQSGFAAGYTTAFLWGVHGLWTGAVTFGVMTAFLQLVAQVQRPALDLARQLPAFVYGMSSAERIAEMIGESRDIQDRVRHADHGSDISGSRHAGTGYTAGTHGLERVGVRLGGVCFRYPDAGDPVISGLSHDFAPGTFTAVTGATGVGKTTLLRLLLAFAEPSGGSVSFYGDGWEEKATACSRRLVTFVPQGNTLVSGTIRSNLRTGNPTASGLRMEQALKAACAEFVFDLPAGLDTRIGEGAAALSEGQAQRIAIARALLRDVPVILLDEPTSALDPATESRLLASLATLAPRHTVIMITHRSAAASVCTHRISL